MARTSKLLTEEVVALAEAGLESLGRSGSVAIKLRAILSAHKYGITDVAKAFGTTKATLISWIKYVKDEPLLRLNVQTGRGRKSLVTDEQRNIIAQWLAEDSQITIDQMRQKIMTHMNIELGRSTVHRIIKKLNFSYITPRPRHYKQDVASLTEAKKKSS